MKPLKALFEEVVCADVLLHVHDSSSPLVAEEAADVSKVLGDLGIGEETQKMRVLHVFNKLDLLEPKGEEITYLKNMFANGVFVSAKTGDGVIDLLAHLDWHLGKSEIFLTVCITPIDGAARAWLHQNAVVESSYFDNQGNECILVSIEPKDHARLCSRWPDLVVWQTEA